MLNQVDIFHTWQSCWYQIPSSSFCCCSYSADQQRNTMYNFILRRNNFVRYQLDLTNWLLKLYCRYINSYLLTVLTNKPVSLLQYDQGFHVNTIFWFQNLRIFPSFEKTWDTKSPHPGFSSLSKANQLTDLHACLEVARQPQKATGRHSHTHNSQNYKLLILHFLFFSQIK